MSKYKLCLYDEVGGVTKEEQIIILDLVAEAIEGKKSPAILEIGTFKGHTTQAIAQNYPKISVWTVDLPTGVLPVIPDIFAERPYYGKTQSDSVITANNVTQVFADSGLPLGINQKFNLVFIDGGHSFLQLLNDTIVALELVKKGGIIVWHDYGDCYRHTLVRVLDALNKFKPLTFHTSTKLVSVKVD